jgi:23S rRNA pseudouridine1911/1915/1917 synthase
VLHRDEDLAVVRKPAGALSQSIPHRIHEPSVAGSLLAQGLVPPGVGPSLSSGLAHRLDRWTSGLLVVGRTDRALERIQSSFRRRRVRKEYLAVVEGDVRGESGEIDRPITRDYSRVWRFKVAGPNSKRGKRALTRYRVVERLPGATLLAVRILTGRTHQIRVHLSSVGHPVVGDRMYGATRPSGFPPLLLHAARLGLPHPATRRWVRFEAPPDATFEACLRLLRQGAMLQAHASEPALEEAPARVDAPAGEGAPASAEAPSGAVASTREETAALDEASTRTREETAALDEASSATAAPALAEAGDYPSDEDRAGMRASSTSPGSS